MVSNPGSKIVTKIIFPVNDVGAAAAFYEALGFDVEMYGEGYAWVKNGSDEVLHLALAADLDPAFNHSAGYFHVQDIAAWHKAWTAAGALVQPIADQPWAMREFELSDPWGNLLRVGQNV